LLPYSDVSKELLPCYPGLPNDRRNGSAWDIAIVIRDGGVATRMLVEKLVVAAGNSDDREAAVFQSRYDFPGL